MSETIMDNKYLIHCKTEALSKKVLDVLHEEGYKWNSGDPLSTYYHYWREKKDGTIYYAPNQSGPYVNSICYGHIETGFPEDELREIITAEDFLALKADVSQTQDYYKVGDLVTMTNEPYKVLGVVHKVTDTSLYIIIIRTNSGIDVGKKFDYGINTRLWQVITDMKLTLKLLSDD